MNLTTDERAILDGRDGTRKQQYMDWLVRWGDAMGATDLIPVTNVQTSGISAPGNLVPLDSDNVVRETLEQVWEFTAEPVSVPTFTHVARMTLDYPQQRQTPQVMVDSQSQVIDRARDAGINLTWTCAPYISGVVPTKGQICAWTESSAVVYINSILGARSTRNGSESAMAAAVIGKVPQFGALTDMGRFGDFIVDVDVPLLDPADWGALGYWAGEVAGLKTPVFVGLPSPSTVEAKQLSATLATTGGVTMFHIVGVTPEAPELSAVITDATRRERFRFGEQELTTAYQRVRTLRGSTIDYVVLGCPHASLEELQAIACLLHDRQVHDGVKLEVWTPYAMKALAQRLGYVSAIEAAGGRVLSDTCPAVSRVGQGHSMATPSFKQAHYAPGMLGAEVAVGTLQQCIDAALSGTWEANL